MLATVLHYSYSSGIMFYLFFYRVFYIIMSCIVFHSNVNCTKVSPPNFVNHNYKELKCNINDKVITVSLRHTDMDVILYYDLSSILFLALIIQHTVFVRKILHKP